MRLAVRIPDYDMVGIHALDNAVVLAQNHNAGINRRFVFHTGTDNRGLGF